MHSKLLPWDFVNKFPNVLTSEKAGVFCYLIENPFFENYISKKIHLLNLGLNTYTGIEITKNFLDENFINLNFFSDSNNILVMSAETIPLDTWEYWKENNIEVNDKIFILLFSKSSKVFQQMAKDNMVNSVTIEEPRFWEGAKLWQFCQKMKGVSYNSEISVFILDSLEHNFESFFWAIELMQQHFLDGKVNLAFIKNEIKKSRYDFFELIDLFHYDRSKFWDQVLNKEVDFEWLRSLGVFFQIHLVKVLDPEEIIKKSKQTKYDLQIIELNKKENLIDLKYYIRFFSELEIKAKSKDILVANYLRLESLK